MSAWVECRGKVSGERKLMQHLWNTDEFVTDASLTVLVSRLRSKLRDISGGKEIIGTKKRKGILYHMKKYLADRAMPYCFF